MDTSIFTQVTGFVGSDPQNREVGERRTISLTAKYRKTCCRFIGDG